jgi:hypothetical protein
MVPDVAEVSDQAEGAQRGERRAKGLREGSAEPKTGAQRGGAVANLFSQNISITFDITPYWLNFREF